MGHNWIGLVALSFWLILALAANGSEGLEGVIRTRNPYLRKAKFVILLPFYILCDVILLATFRDRVVIKFIWLKFYATWTGQGPEWLVGEEP
jgi:hypothetical protein